MYKIDKRIDCYCPNTCTFVHKIVDILFVYNRIYGLSLSGVVYFPTKLCCFNLYTSSEVRVSL